MDSKEIIELTREFENLTKEQLVKSLLELGLISRKDLLSAPKRIKAGELIRERKELRSVISSYEKRVSEITTKLVTACDHEYGESKSSNDHDGYSRCDYTQTTTRKCNICEHVDTSTKTCTY